MGQGKSQGSFYTSIRQRQLGEAKGEAMEGFVDTAKMKGKQFVETTLQQQAQRYHKKFAFERGQYHQCLPNPRNGRQRITVQLVDRVLYEKTGK